MYISCTTPRRKLRATSNTSRNLHIRPVIQHVMSSAASGISDIGGAVGGLPPSPPTSVHPSPASPRQPLGPLDLHRKHEIIKMFQSSTSSMMHPTSRRHQWTSRTSTTGLKSRSSGQQTSTSRRSSTSTSGPVLHIRMTQRLATSFSMTSSYVMLKIRTGYSCPTSTQHFRLAVLTSISTSIYISRPQMRSTSRSHRHYFLERMTGLTAIGRGSTPQRTSTQGSPLSPRWILTDHSLPFELFRAPRLQKRIEKLLPPKTCFTRLKMFIECSNFCLGWATGCSMIVTCQSGV